MAFERDPLRGVAVGIGLALSVTAVVEAVRFVRRRRRGGAAAGRDAGDGVRDGRGVDGQGVDERSGDERVGPEPGV